MENKSLGNDDARDQLQLGARAAARAIAHSVAPWWAYLASGAVWTVMFAIMLWTKWFWILPVGIGVGIAVIAWLKVRVTGVKVLPHRWSRLSNRGVIWVVVVFLVVCAVMAAGLTGYELLQAAWIPWVTGASCAAILVVSEWRLDVSVRTELRGAR